MSKEETSITFCLHHSLFDIRHSASPCKTRAEHHWLPAAWPHRRLEATATGSSSVKRTATNDLSLNDIGLSNKGTLDCTGSPSTVALSGWA